MNLTWLPAPASCRRRRAFASRRPKLTRGHSVMGEARRLSCRCQRCLHHMDNFFSLSHLTLLSAVTLGASDNCVYQVTVTNVGVKPLSLVLINCDTSAPRPEQKSTRRHISRPEEHLCKSKPTALLSSHTSMDW